MTRLTRRIRTPSSCSSRPSSSALDTADHHYATDVRHLVLPAESSTAGLGDEEYADLAGYGTVVCHQLSHISCRGQPYRRPDMKRPAGVTTEKSGSLRPDVGRITCGSGVCVGVPAVLRAGRLLLDRSHLTRPISTQLWTTSFPVYDDANPPSQTGSRGFTSCRAGTGPTRVRCIYPASPTVSSIVRASGAGSTLSTRNEIGGSFRPGHRTRRILIDTQSGFGESRSPRSTSVTTSMPNPSLLLTSFASTESHAPTSVAVSDGGTLR